MTDPNTPGEALLPKPPGVFRRWLAAHPRTVDGFIVGAYLLGCALAATFVFISANVVNSVPEADPAALEALEGRTDFLTFPWIVVSAAIVALVAICLAYRRRFPLAGVAVVSALLFFEQGAMAVPGSVAVVFLLYAVPVYRGTRAGWIAFAVALIASSIPLLFSGEGGRGLIGPTGVVLSDETASLGDQIAVSVANGLWLLAVLMIGINLGNRRRYVQALIDRAHQLASEREQRARLAVAGERARIAREMHDIVAHSLSVVVTLSEAAAVSIDTQPAAAKRAVERSAETGRQALVEMRRLLGVLDDDSDRSSVVAPAPERGARDGAAYAPQPGLAQLPELISDFTEAGLRVSLVQDGVPVGDATHQLAVYRVTQEALTNALRHAGRQASVTVRVSHLDQGSRDDGSGGESETRIEVIDSGGRRATNAADRPGASDPPVPLQGAGRGLAGARERVRMFGGRFEAGPFEDGWRLVAEIPAQRGKDRARAARSVEAPPRDGSMK